MKLITERYKEKIKGIISCFDRVIIKGTMTRLCYPEGMTSHLYSNNIKIFDYAKEFAEPLRQELRDNAERIAKENNIKIEFIAKSGVRKESIIKKKLEARGNHPGLVGIISAMEKCKMYVPYYDSKTKYPKLKMKPGKCIHYYYYFVDAKLGLCYVRVPTWSPFNLQIYFNGHNWLSNELQKANIEHKMLDNAFIEISDYDKAQEISDSFSGEIIKELLDSFAEKYCPIIKKLPSEYHWSISQAEYATDIIFENQEDLAPIYESIVRTATTAVKVENIATFLGRKLHPNYQQEMGNNYNKRIEGTRIKHSMGKASIKMYDKYGHILRIETSINDVSFFKHYRKVEKVNGEVITKEANMKKGIYSIAPLREKLIAANTRYLKFISTFEDNSGSINKITELSETKKDHNNSYRGFNFFNTRDQMILETISRGEFNINGFYNKNIRSCIEDESINSGKMTRILKRLRIHGLIKKVGNTKKYYLTEFGRQVSTAIVKVKEFIVVPVLSVEV